MATAYINCGTRPAIKFLLCVMVTATLAGGLALLAQADTFSPRLKTPRIAPVPEQGRTRSATSDAGFAS